MKYFNSFLNNKKGALAIEFAFCFLLFMLILFIIYDAYSTIILQAKGGFMEQAGAFLAD